MFKIIFELLQSIPSGNLRREQHSSMHMTDQGSDGPPANATASGQEEGAPGEAQHSVDPRHILQHFLEK